jgi:glycosyltransferase involved in cell wall biosynthesis
VRLLLVTDAWAPQVNGVVRTLETVVAELRRRGDQVEVVHPGQFRTVPCPTYPDIRLALAPARGVRQAWERFQPDAVHIATEGPLGMAARRQCLRRRQPFSTAFHTRFPEYVHARTRLPVGISYRVMRWFHGPAARVMVATETVQKDLERYGFDNCVRWSRGVDTELFRPEGERALQLPGPVFLYCGRVAVEKNIEAFLALDLPGTKLVVGDGPARPSLERRFPTAVFAGMQRGAALAAHYRSADVFVFPSRTDTFGLVMLEALASGLPVAAYPVSGPLDVVGGTDVAVLDEDLERAARAALQLDPGRCRSFAEGHSWARCADLFRSHLALPVDRAPGLVPERATGA